MSPFERFSLPIFFLLFITDDGVLSLFLASVLSSRYGKWVTLLIHFLCTITISVIVCFLPVQIAAPTMYLLLLIITCICYKDKLARKLLAHGLCIVGIIGCQMAVAAILEVLGFQIIELTRIPAQHILVLLGTYSLYYPYLFLISGLLNQKFQRANGMIYFALIPICEMVMLGALVGCALYINNVFIRIALFVSAALAIVSIICLFWGMRCVIESTKTETRYSWLQTQQRLQSEYSAVLENQLYETRKFRHDLLNYIHTLDLLLKEGHYQEFKNCAQYLQSNLTITHQIQYCAHPVVNAVLYYKLTQAKALSITAKVKLVISADCGVETTDLIGLFSNLLDNAIEACAEVKDAPWFSLIDRHNGNLYTITLYNSKQCEPIKFKDGKPITRKSAKSNHGFGLEILEEIARKYNGTLSIHDEGTRFVSNVLLQLPHSTADKMEDISDIATHGI